MSLGSKLRNLREQRGISQKELASRLKIPNQNVSNYERNFRQPDYDTLKKFANFFQVSTDYLLGVDNNQNPVDKEEEEFLAFANDPELEVWYKELPKTDEERLRRLRKVWEALKDDE
ncbi:helix-turn-helix domain-containing protein [Jeotgalibacillus proteolyticus]|uniref:XRE family transcriptional regulator n=1 Tax=Jeotgalibacillus proteolyticus TaxID=2082395 RepID=A0A2S5GGE0_9BACL|nr:helix-turn-helix transcriptional regulator [Jeotgalibacillus proteolyticus]PPA71933.1 XRE family transcriptional regulator [Jeotgalibacillus proteolyticus]